MKKFAFIIPPTVELLDLAGPVQVFTEAKFYGFEASIEFYTYQDVPQSTSGLVFHELKNFIEANLKEDDYVFVPGMDNNYVNSMGFKSEHLFFNWLKECSRKKGNCLFHLYRSICFGACWFTERHGMHYPLETRW